MLLVRLGEGGQIKSSKERVLLDGGMGGCKLLVWGKPSAESHQEVHVHGENPQVNEIPDEEDPGCRRDGRRVLESHILRPLPEDACSQRGAAERGQGRSREKRQKFNDSKNSNTNGLLHLIWLRIPTAC